MFRLFFQLFFGCYTDTLPGTYSAPFSAVFRLFSISGTWHLCRWPQRLQFQDLVATIHFSPFTCCFRIFFPSFTVFFATRATIYKSLRALRGPVIPKQSYKESFWGSAKKSPKIPEKVKIPKIGLLGVFFDIFRYFRGLFADAQKDSFRDFFGILGPEGPETPVNGRPGRKLFFRNENAELTESLLCSLFTI